MKPRREDMERERKDLEARLEAQESMRLLVQALPDEEPSMAWRSELNERLRAMTTSPKSKTWGWLWKPAAGLGLASLLVVTVFMKAGQPQTALAGNETAMAQAMIQAHQQTVAHQELGTVPVEALSSDSASVPTDLNEVDLTTL